MNHPTYNQYESGNPRGTPSGAARVRRNRGGVIRSLRCCQKCTILSTRKSFKRENPRNPGLEHERELCNNRARDSVSQSMTFAYTRSLQQYLALICLIILLIC